MLSSTSNHFDQIMNKYNQQTERPKFTRFREKALDNSEVKKEYEALIPTYKLRKKLITLKKQ
ncbi:MAG: hypothetical protein AAGE84_21105 [Cyanobacteria bacterium P01_G01_bin.39]